MASFGTIYSTFVLTSELNLKFFGRMSLFTKGFLGSIPLTSFTLIHEIISSNEKIFRFSSVHLKARKLRCL